MSEMAFIAKNASSLRLFNFDIRRVPIITRRVRALSFEELFARLSALMVFLCQSVTAHLEQERMLALFCPRLLPWLTLQESPIEYCPFAYHSEHSPTFLSTLNFVPF